MSDWTRESNQLWNRFRGKTYFVISCIFFHYFPQTHILELRVNCKLRENSGKVLDYHFLNIEISHRNVCSNRVYAQIVDKKKLNSKNVRKNRAKKCQVLEIVSNLSCLIDLKTSQLRWKFTGSISEFFISWTTARSFLLPHKVLSNKWKVNFHYERSPNFAFYKAKNILERP